MLIFDAHLDLSLNALQYNRDLSLTLEELNQREEGLDDVSCRGKATVVFPEMRRGEVYCSLATLLSRWKPDVKAYRRAAIDYSDRQVTKAMALGQLAYYEGLVERGDLVFLKTSSDLAEHLKKWKEPGTPLGFVLAMEGADPILTPGELPRWQELGLRALGLSHYGPHPYAFGTGSEGDLPAEGRELLRAMMDCGIILDTTHLSDRCFDQALEAYDGPVFASHCNSRTLVPGQRQVSDSQIDRILERGGLVCIACDAWMLSPGYRRPTPSYLCNPQDKESWRELDRTPRNEIPFSSLADHIDFICQRAGDSRHAGIGSDLDGGFGTEQCPEGLDSIADLQKLEGLLSQRGYSPEDIANIFRGNLHRFLQTHLPK